MRGTVLQTPRPVKDTEEVLQALELRFACGENHAEVATWTMEVHSVSTCSLWKPILEQSPVRNSRPMDR